MNPPPQPAGDFKLAPNAAWPHCAAPTVSVVISLFNYAAYIGECLASVAATDAKNLPGGFEIIVVDDASTDDSVSRTEKFMATSPLPICLIKKNSNSGVASARNLGLQAARASFVFILDADNFIRPHCLSVHYHALASSACALVYGTINRFDHATRQSAGTLSDREWSVRELVARPYIDTMVMLRKDVVLRVGGYSAELTGWQDYDLCLKLALAGHSAQWIQETLSDYRVHAAAMNRTTQLHQRELSTYFAKKFFPLVPLAEGDWLFGSHRNELALATGTKPRFQNLPPTRAACLLRSWLGEKLCRSLVKRLTSFYCWLFPLAPLPGVGKNLPPDRAPKNNPAA